MPGAASTVTLFLPIFHNKHVRTHDHYIASMKTDEVLCIPKPLLKEARHTGMHKQKKVPRKVATI